MKKRMAALFAAAAFLLCSCSNSGNINSEETDRPSIGTVSKTPEPASSSSSEENTASQTEEPGTTIPEVIAPTYSEEEIASGQLYLSGKEQFVVSKNKNIITIILDAVDNRYISELLQTDPEAFNGLEDFTVYTDTCSVFDSTFQSVTQIYAGFDALPSYGAAQWSSDAWGSEKVKEFYSRFHKAGYKMNFYTEADLILKDQMGLFDNIALSRETMETRDFYHMNKGFQDRLSTMKTADNDYNYFIVEHILGAHSPIDVYPYTEQIKFLFDIVREYLDNLKSFGVYDDATIIIMADHGVHDRGIYGLNATPMFMIKEANASHEEIKVSAAPIYFTDLMSTYLINAGLYNEETDRDLFGSSIYDFDEDSERERVINYRSYSDDYPPSAVSSAVPSYGYNILLTYKYTGDTEELLNVINQRNPTVTWMEEDAA